MPEPDVRLWMVYGAIAVLPLQGAGGDLELAPNLEIHRFQQGSKIFTISSGIECIARD